MKTKIILSTIATTTLLIFSGCGASGLAVNTLDNNKVDRYFHQGYIVSQKKVMIDESLTATLQGVAGGAIIGGAVDYSQNKRVTGGALLGAAIGGVAGLFNAKEIVAYETIIKSNDKEYLGYLKQKLSPHTKVEFTIKDNKLKNVEVLTKN